MKVTSLLVNLTLGLVSASAISSKGNADQDGDDGRILARSAATSIKDTTIAKRHLHARSGAHEQQGKELDHQLRSKKKRQSSLSFVNDSPKLIKSSGQNSGSTGTGTGIDNSGEGNTGGKSTGYRTTGFGDTGTGNTGSGNTIENGSGVPADRGAPARQVSNLETPAADDTSSQKSVPATGSGSGNTTPNGCAHEDGAASGNPGWTCGSGGSSPASNNALKPRDLTSLRFNKRQSAPAYVQTMNTWRSKFCLPPLTYDSALEQSAVRQGNDAASQGSMVETPSNGEGTVMAQGGGEDFEWATLSWLCEVHTTNMDRCACANAYSNSRFTFQWTERGHYDFLVGKQAGQFGSIGCAYNDALRGLWTCSLGMK